MSPLKTIDLTTDPHLGLFCHGAIMALLTEHPEADAYTNVAHLAMSLAVTCRSTGMVPNRIEYWPEGSTTPGRWVATYPFMLALGYNRKGEEAYALVPCPTWLRAMIE